MQHLPTYKKSVIFITLLLALIFVTPVLADYLGPDRTRTTYVAYCRYVQKRCAQQDNNQWEWHTVEDWDCSHGNQGCSGGGGACNKDNNGARSCERDEGVREETVTYDPATIAGSVSCTVQNGWCNGASVPELALSASEPVSGYKILLIEGTLNGTMFACQDGVKKCRVPLLEGDNAFNFWALSSWGDSSLMGSQSARVDTVPPEVGLSVTGTSGHSGWYKSDIDVSAIASDATSGVATFEVAVDEGGYQTYTPVTLDDGRHTLQFRVVDQAGNVFESPVQKFSVDTVPPMIDLPSAWRLGKDVDYSVRDDGSGLASVRIVIEDEDEKYAKMTWDRDASGTSYASHIDWNGEFKDKTVAPPGTYQLWVKAKDVAGNERFAMGKIIVSAPNMPLVALPTADPLATEVALLPPAELVETDTVLVTVGQSVVDGETSQSGQTTTQTILLTTGSAGAAASTTTSGVLWGAVAAAAISAATAYAVETTRKRKEAEEAQAAAVRAEVAEDKARQAEHGMTKAEKQEAKAQQSESHDAKVQQRKEQQSWANPAKEKAQLKWEQERDAAYAQVVWDKWQEEQAALEQKRQQEATARMEQQRQQEATTRAEQKWEQQEALAETKWIAAQERKEKAQQDAQENAAKRAEEKSERAELVHENITSRRTVDEPAEPSNWWEKTKAFVKNNVIDPVNEKVIQPYVKPAIESTKKTVQVVNEKVIQPYVVPYVEQRIEDVKKIAAWTNENIIQPYVVPYVEQRIDGVKKVAAWTNENIIQPYVQPYVEKRIEGIKQDITWINENVVQPYVQPYVEKRIEGIKQDIAWINENIFQPYIAPAVSVVNEKVIQPYIQPYIETQIEAAKDVIKFVDDKIYQPVFAPVVNDINKYIYQPLAEKTSEAWDKYGEWVHNSLDVAGFIPGFGDIADGINGVIYLAEGRYIEASVSALSMIPIVGDIVGKGGKVAVKVGTAVAGAAAVKIAKEVVEEAIEKGVKEVVEEGLEKAAKEVGEEIAEETTEKLAKEISEDVLEKGAKEAIETAAEKVAKEVGEEAIEKGIKEALEVAAENTTKNTADTVAKKVAGDVAKNQGDVVAAVLSGKEALQLSVEKIIEETPQLVSKETTQRALKEVVEGKVTKLPADIAKDLTDDKVAKELAQKLSEELGGKSVWVSAKTGVVYVSAPPAGWKALAAQLDVAVKSGDKDAVRSVLRQIAEQTTRGSGNHVVLGPFAPDGAFIQEALDTGGVFWDVGGKDEFWNAMAETGLDMFEANDAFLRLQVERGVDSFDVMAGTNVSEVIKNFNDSPVRPWDKIYYREKEILDLATMPNVPYKLDGNSWKIVR